LAAAGTYTVHDLLTDPLNTLNREAHELGYKFSPIIFFEKLALAFPPDGPTIADMETFRATMRRPAVQEMYKADYELCQNPKRGAILKLLEVAGVDASVVKVDAARGQ